MKLTVENNKEPKDKSKPVKPEAVKPTKPAPQEAKPAGAKKGPEVKPEPAKLEPVKTVESVAEEAKPAEKKPAKRDLTPWLAWGGVAIMVLILLGVTLQFFGVIPTAAAPAPEPESTETALNVPMPEFNPTESTSALKPAVNPKTTLPDRKSEYATSYTVQVGDSIFGIATQYKLKPESVLWSNYSQLKDDPQNISVGSTLNIPPVDGIYYLWQEGDTLEGVAGKYKVNPEDILMWPGNNIDMINPVIQPNQYVMIPGGQSEIKQWVVPIAYSPHSGATRSINNQCAIPDGYYAGTGSFIWPSANHSISGNDFWSGHLGIDIGAYLGDTVWASDSGIVVFSGGRTDGYGGTVIIEHDIGGDTYHTLYAHLSAESVRCGQLVSQGQVIGAAGATGNATGPHIHFEIRKNGGFINPHQVLP